MKMRNKPIEPMRAENVEEFEVRIFDGRDLVVSVVPLLAPWSATAENYPVNQPSL
jgi:hypothetical protein